MDGKVPYTFASGNHDIGERGETRTRNTLLLNQYLPYEKLTEAVHLYNSQKPHRSLNRLSPETFEKRISEGLLTKTWVINKK